MASTAIPEAHYLSAETEIIRERSDRRAFARMLALMCVGAVLAITLTVAAVYQVIIADPLVARHASGVGPALQTLLPFAKEKTQIARERDDGSDLGDIAPAAGPGATPDQ